MSENDDYLRPWASDMLRVGAVDNRGNPSERALAKIAGVSNATVSRTLRGMNSPGAPTVQKIANALEIKPTEVWRRLGSDDEQTDPYDPPAESAYLSHRERKLVTEMIRVLVEGRHELPTDHPRPSADAAPVAGPAQRDGATTDTAHKPLPKDSWALAARRSEHLGKPLDDAMDAAGEESQDPDGV